MNGRDHPLPRGAIAVIFTSRLKNPAPGYAEEARRMVALAAECPGFLGMESWRDETGRGVTISWWESREAIAHWKQHPEHRAAQARAADWYEEWQIAICELKAQKAG